MATPGFSHAIVTAKQTNNRQITPIMQATEIKETIRQYIAQNILFSDSGFPHSDDASFLREGIIDSV